MPYVLRYHALPRSSNHDQQHQGDSGVNATNVSVIGKRDGLVRSAAGHPGVSCVFRTQRASAKCCMRDVLNRGEMRDAAFPVTPAVLADSGRDRHFAGAVRTQFHSSMRCNALSYGRTVCSASCRCCNRPQGMTSTTPERTVLHFSKINDMDWRFLLSSRPSSNRCVAMEAVVSERRRGGTSMLRS